MQTSVDETKKSQSPALTRGIAILDLIAATAEPLSLSEISRLLGLPKSSVHGLCEALCQSDLLRLEGRGYCIGAHPLRWGQAFRARSNVVAEFQRLIGMDPVLREFTVSLSVLDRDHVTYLASHHATKPLGMVFTPGSRLPAAFTSTGKVMLAQLGVHARADLLQHWPQPLTPCSVPDLDRFEQQMLEWQSLGYALDREEVRTGMVCIGVAIPGPGAAAGGLALSMTRQEADQADLGDLAGALSQVASVLSLVFAG